MTIKLVEIRDRGTFIPAMAVRLYERTIAERFLLESAGYASGPYVILCKLDGVEAQYDPFKWDTPGRTMRAAHTFIIENWDSFETGAVIDVEHILGERPTKKVSERFS